MASYLPDRGDLVWLNFTPQATHEQAGRRPALVISPQAYNRKTGLFLACPITSQVRDYPFEVALPPASPIRGVVLSDHVKNLDWKARRAEFAGKVPADTISEVSAKLSVLISPP